MATPKKRRAASPRERADKSPTKSNGTAKGVQTPGGPTAHQMFGNYRTFKMLQMLMQATEQFLQRFSPFMTDDAARQAGELNASLFRTMPLVNAHIDRMEGKPNAIGAEQAAKDGAA